MIISGAFPRNRDMVRCAKHNYNMITSWSIFFFGHAWGKWMSLGQGSNLHHSRDPNHWSDNTKFLTCYTTREFPVLRDNSSEFFRVSVQVSCCEKAASICVYFL